MSHSCVELLYWEAHPPLSACDHFQPPLRKVSNTSIFIKHIQFSGHVCFGRAGSFHYGHTFILIVAVCTWLSNKIDILLCCNNTDRENWEKAVFFYWTSKMVVYKWLLWRQPQNMVTIWSVRGTCLVHPLFSRSHTEFKIWKRGGRGGEEGRGMNLWCVSVPSAGNKTAHKNIFKIM